MEQIKLKTLYEECKKLVEAGHGEKVLVLSDDNEGNGYHGMFYTLTVLTPDNKKDFAGLVSDNQEPNLENIIILG